MQEFLERNEINRRNVWICVLAFMYNASNVALYFESPNLFLEHYFGPTRHPLTDFSDDDAGEIAGFVGIILFCIPLAISNQSGYKKHIGNLNVFRIDDAAYEDRTAYPLLSPPEKPQSSKFAFFIAGVGALYKAGVGSSSLAAFLHSNFNNPAFAISSAVITGIGNFFAQFAILDTEFKYPLSNPLSLRTIAVHLLTALYNIPNAFLYFNAGDAFLKNIDVLDHRLIDGSEWWEKGLLALLGVSSAFLFISTQRSYSQKLLEKVIDDKEQEPESPSCCDPLIEKLKLFIPIEATYTAIYKAAINYVAFVSAVFDLTKSYAGAFILATICLPGNLTAMYSVLAPSRSEDATQNESPGLFYRLMGGNWKRDFESIPALQNPHHRQSFHV